MQLYIDEESQKLDYFYHFTTFKAFKSIITNFCLYMSKIGDNLNDKKEQLYVNNIGDFYITCFTSEINDALWNHDDYGKGEEQAVCIGIKTKNLDQLKIRYDNGDVIESHHRISQYNDTYSFYDFGLYGLSIHKVIYKNNPMTDYIFDEELYNFFAGCCNLDREKLKENCKRITNRGYVKSNIDNNGVDQTKEKEHRIIAVVLYKGIRIKEPRAYDYINRVLMDFSALKNNITIYVKNKFIYKDELVSICKECTINYSILK